MRLVPKKLRAVTFSLMLTCLWSFSVGAAHAVEYDPWEPVNLRVHIFNEYMDDKVLRPVANTYVRYVPRFARRGVSNFFSNIGDVSNLANNLLQLKFQDAASDTGRLLLNTTIGVGGLFDVATGAGFEKNEEDFGQTLGRWGVAPGPYMVLPFFGPSTLRDTVGLGVDTYSNPLNQQDEVRLRNIAFAVQQLDRRVAALALDSMMSGDTYIFTREAYLQQRQYLVSDGEIDDDWDDWGDWD